MWKKTSRNPWDLKGIDPSVTPVYYRNAEFMTIVPLTPIGISHIVRSTNIRSRTPKNWAVRKFLELNVLLPGEVADRQLTNAWQRNVGHSICDAFSQCSLHMAAHEI